MKTLKNTIKISIVVSIISLIISIIFEFNNISKHDNYILNISIGMFASGTLIVFTSITGFICEKRKYYINAIQKSSHMITSCLNIIDILENYAQDVSPSGYFNEIRAYYNDIFANMTDYSYFFKMSKSEILIESILSDTTKFLLIQAMLFEYSSQLKSGKINEYEYSTAFNTIRKDMIEEREKFNNHLDSIKDNMNKLVKDRELKTIKS